MWQTKALAFVQTQANEVCLLNVITLIQKDRKYINLINY